MYDGHKRDQQYPYSQSTKVKEQQQKYSANNLKQTKFGTNQNEQNDKKLLVHKFSRD